MSRYSASSTLQYIGDNEDIFDQEEVHVRWSDLIFLPFNPVFQLMVIISVLIKCTLGPIQSVYPIVYCWDVMDNNPFLSPIKLLYQYCCDPLYGIDTFLHIVHRQVTDKAMRREHMPKSAFLLLLDIVSLIPLFKLMAVDECPPTQLWPNVLTFTECLVMYRVVEYFSIATTHSFCKLLFGFIVMFLCCANVFTCFWLLLTKHGLCSKCSDSTLLDWRGSIAKKLNESDERYTTYVYGLVFIISYTLNEPIDEAEPATIKEFMIIIIFLVIGYLTSLFIFLPKLFAEAVLRLRRVFAAHPHIEKLVEETKRRNTNPKAFVNVDNFYRLMWRKRSGIVTMPSIFNGLPRYLRIDINQDLVWPVFYHSPSLRKTSISFKRWLCEFIKPDFKLPGERFFSEIHSYTNLFYIKSGVVQLLSSDEGITSILSATSGTIFGDINFFVPPYNRKVTARCLTYCEVLYIKRSDYLTALHKFPAERRNLQEQAKERIKHARTLYACKENIRGLDRTEDEGIAWVKRRWWEISEYLNNWKNKGLHKKDHINCILPSEEAVYHCAKYIGQLVLCTDVELQRESMFANVKFPWILVPQSSFVKVWRRIVLCTVMLVLLFYPPYITSTKLPIWFTFLQVWTDFVYISDLCISLVTTSSRNESFIATFTSVMFARCKTMHFNLDLCATLWIEYFTVIIGHPEYFTVAQLNRLLKLYIFFIGDYMNFDIRSNIMIKVALKIVFTKICYIYITGYTIYNIYNLVKDIKIDYFFGDKICNNAISRTECDIVNQYMLAPVIAWAMEYFFPEYAAITLSDIYLGMITKLIGYTTSFVCYAVFIASVYLKHREVANFQYFVSNLKGYYKNNKIHIDLLKRLDRYLYCHWKYYKGAEVMHPQTLSNEPYDIYKKVQGEVAEKIIGESEVFLGADPALIREMAYSARFLMLPKDATLFLFGLHCKNVTWIVQGHVKCEFFNENGELLKVQYDPGYLLSPNSIFMGRASLRTYTASTDCEILYVKRLDFFKIIHRYPAEWSVFESSIKEFGPAFNDMFYKYVMKHKEYQIKLRDRIFHARRSVTAPKTFKPVKTIDNRTVASVEVEFWAKPESNSIKNWMLFRMIIVIVSILTAALQGGIGALYRRQLMLVGAFCDCIAWIDIILKMFLAYYDERGLVITDKWKCTLQYLSRGFLLDIIGALPWFDMLRTLMYGTIPERDAMLINTMCKFAHIYLLLGYFNYTADKPTINFAYVMIVKWQITVLLIVVGASHFFISYCVEYTFDRHHNLVNMTISKNTCWSPELYNFSESLNVDQLHTLFVNSLNLAQCGLLSISSTIFHIDRDNLGVGFGLFFLMIMFWYVMGYSVTLLVLNSRGNNLFQHGVNQLMNFLSAERVPKELIDKAVAHFTYWWTRTKGINIHHLTNERIGVVFRQDLSYYFYRKTFLALDTLLSGGESLGRQLASASVQIYILPNFEIVREMDLTYWVFVVHRGKIVISKDGEKLATLTKGSIFGQLDGTTSRPVKISAVAEGYTDLLQIHIKQFQELIDDDIRNKIAENPQSKNDYMSTKKRYIEDAYDTVKFLIRRPRALQLPGISEPLKATNDTLYTRWLYLVWLIGPFITSFIVIILITLPKNKMFIFYMSLLPFDIIHLVNFCLEFYSIKLVVENKKCVERIVGVRRFRDWSFYLDVVALLVPFITLLHDSCYYQLARLVRLKHFFDFEHHFCKNFKSKLAPIILKLAFVFLLLHALSCGWIFVACREDTFPMELGDIPHSTNMTINSDEWVHPKNRKGGCPRMVLQYKSQTKEPVFVVPKYFLHDYILALAHIVLLQTHTAQHDFISLTGSQVYYKLFITIIMYNLHTWISSIAISYVYTRYRELYQYDYDVSTLVTYLRDSGLSPALLDSVEEYAKQLWRRQSGNWLPELAQQAPICLREDLFCSLYIHHLQTPPLFRELPTYFIRQVAARLKRIVLFPGKCLVQEGDLYQVIYFIHEGEVEKWYADKNGESKYMSLLSTNDYFGFIPGLFNNVPFQFSYHTRTVVDMVFLRLDDWKDLLDGYPDIKRDLYTAAKHLKKEIHRTS